MHFYEQDKAIEFNGLYKDIERMISSLEKIEINVKEEKAAAAKIKEECENGVSIGAVQMQAETQYSEGIKRLKEIMSKLEEHQVYYDSYTEAQKIESGLNKKDITNEQIKVYANGTIALLNQIQSSDTRAYNSEKTIVERIYSLAYNVIKLEIIANGKSIVLEWVKNDKIAASFINGLIVQDLALLEGKITNDIIKETIYSIRSSGLNPSYFDEGLILFIAMQKKSSLKYIENSLLSIIKDITQTEQLMESSQTDNVSLETRINELRNTIKKSRIYKELGLTISLIALLSGLKYGSEKIVKLIGHNEYKTDVDYFSTQLDAQTPEYPEYMTKINNNFSKTTLTAYDVWRQENIFFGEYQRNVITYDLSNIDLESLEDYLSYDFSELTSSNSTTETAEELNPDELYDKAIVEIIRLSQDENSEKFVPNEELQEFILVVLSTIGAILAGIGEFLILKSIINKLKNNHKTKVIRKDTIKEWEEGLKKYKQLCEENTEFKKRFIDMYQRFSLFIRNPEIKARYQRILKKEE